MKDEREWKRRRSEVFCGGRCSGSVAAISWRAWRRLTLELSSVERLVHAKLVSVAGSGLAWEDTYIQLLSSIRGFQTLKSPGLLKQ